MKTALSCPHPSLLPGREKEIEEDLRKREKEIVEDL
jgi:hypothetical protein